MWFVKLMGFLLMTGCGAYLGYKSSSRYKRRERLLNETILFCDSLVNDITYFQPALKEMLKTRLNNYTELKVALTDYIDLIENNANVEIETLREKITKGLFTEDEYSLFIRLLNHLGKSDSQTQRGGILSVKEALLIKRQQAIEESKKYGGLFLKLGVLGGLTAGIVIL
ncbi:MAG TPA: stage III sporulation protein AB [Clostridia bacterium]|jgi:stage III sporulation protein AB